MNLPAQIAGLEAARALPQRPLHLAVGMFDGVHRGHQIVLERALSGARAEDGLAVALTFSPHPSQLLRPEQAVRMIQSTAQRVRALLRSGLDAVVVEPFVEAFAQIEVEAFLPHLLAHLPQLRALYVGENWRYGRGRLGDLASLEAAGREHVIQIFGLARLASDETPISSTRIRAMLEAGEIEAANDLLGYAYSADGVVQPGKQLGRTIGVPTLNLDWAPDCLPRFGVYAGRVRTAGDTTRAAEPAVANFGLRPTVESTLTPRLEVHVLGENRWDAGDHLEVTLERFIRPEQKFADLADLQAAIGQDLTQARQFFGL